MAEIKTSNLQEIAHNHIEGFQNIKPESNITTKEADAYWNKERNEYSQKNEVRETGIPKEFYSTIEQRKEYLPQNGYWTGESGNSKFISYDSEANTELEKYGLDGIEYKNGVPDFSKCCVVSAKIDFMTPDRDKNAKEFYAKLKENGVFDTKSTGRQFAKENELAFHECSDTHICQLVSRKIHETFTHTGGRFECKIRDEKEGIGGSKFDE